VYQCLIVNSFEEFAVAKEKGLRNFFHQEGYACQDEARGKQQNDRDDVIKSQFSDYVIL